MQKWAYDGDGDMVSYVNQMGQRYVFKYNDRDERVEEDDPSPDGGQTPGPVWKWQYSLAGELVEEIDPMGRVTQWVHDGDGDVIQTIAPNLATGAAGGGTWKLDVFVNGTRGGYEPPAIPWNATAGQVADAIAGIGQQGLAPGNINVTGYGTISQPFVVTLLNQLDGVNDALVGGPSAFFFDGDPIDVYVTQHASGPTDSSATIDFSRVQSGNVTAINESFRGGGGTQFLIPYDDTAADIQNDLDTKGDTARDILLLIDR